MARSRRRYRSLTPLADMIVDVADWLLGPAKGKRKRPPLAMRPFDWPVVQRLVQRPKSSRNRAGFVAAASGRFREPAS